MIASLIHYLAIAAVCWLAVAVWLLTGMTMKRFPRRLLGPPACRDGPRCRWPMW